MVYLSDVNLRAVLDVLITRAGGSVYISNAELYDAMMPERGRYERFTVDDAGDGVRLSVATDLGFAG